MKKKTTRELLADSFLELAEKVPINKITIANIVKNCEVTQPTFYRYFKDKYDTPATGGSSGAAGAFEPPACQHGRALITGIPYLYDLTHVF